MNVQKGRKIHPNEGFTIVKGHKKGQTPAFVSQEWCPAKSFLKILYHTIFERYMYILSSQYSIISRTDKRIIAERIPDLSYEKNLFFQERKTDCLFFLLMDALQRKRSFPEGLIFNAR